MNRRHERGSGFDGAIEPLGDARVAEVGDMLGRAFAENPVARAALSHCTTEARLARVKRLNRAMVRATRGAGGVEIARAEGRVLGASLWFAPGRRMEGARALGWMATAMIGVGLRGATRYLIFDQHMGRYHIAEPHYYLFVLGVEPSLQGRGIGSALLESFCARADAEGALSYLETDRASSVRLYERHGFEVTREVDIESLDGLHMWLMERRQKG